MFTLQLRLPFIVPRAPGFGLGKCCGTAMAINRYDGAGDEDIAPATTGRAAAGESS